MRDEQQNNPLGDETSTVSSFLQCDYSRDIAKADVVVTGIPSDLAITNRPGARFGPAAIRKASLQMTGRAWPWMINPLKSLNVIDCGDCPVRLDQPHQLVESIEEHTAWAMAGGASLLTLGGDHFISYPILRAHARKYGPLALIHFDAHADTYETETQLLHHGAVFYYALQEKLIDVEHSIQIGIRTHYRERGFNVLDASWILRHGAEQVAQVIQRVVGEKRAYLSFDLDCLDPAFAPGTGTPVPGGLPTSLVVDILWNLKGVNFVGMDIVELCPPYDVSEISALAAACLGVQYLCLLSSGRDKQGRERG